MIRFVPVAPVPAASILLLRDGRGGLEVLTLRRGRHLAFGGGMLAFPGGRIDASDRAWRGRGDVFGSRRYSDHAFRVGALRELFEETGLLLAAPVHRRRALSERGRRRIARRFRRALQRGTVGFRHVLRRAGLVLEAAALVRFAHWVTPTIAPKRFDTRFYLAAAPGGQMASADEIESNEVAWRSPRAILDAWEAGAESLMFPTRLNLLRLARAASVSQALAMARRAVTMRVEPRLCLESGAPRLVIPAAAGFGVTEAGPRDLHRIEAQALDSYVRSRTMADDG